MKIHLWMILIKQIFLQWNNSKQYEEERKAKSWSEVRTGISSTDELSITHNLQYSAVFIVNSFTLIILLIVCHTILLMLVQRIYYWIKKWSSNSPFYSCMLCCQAFAKGDLVVIQTLLLVKSCLLVTGLYHNMVTFSLTPNQRLGN